MMRVYQQTEEGGGRVKRPVYQQLGRPMEGGGRVNEGCLPADRRPMEGGGRVKRLVYQQTKTNGGWGMACLPAGKVNGGSCWKEGVHRRKLKLMGNGGGGGGVRPGV